MKAQPKQLFFLSLLFTALLLSACNQVRQTPEALEEQSAAQSATVDFPSSIQLDEELEVFDFTGSVHVVAQCRAQPDNSCRFNTNLAEVSGTGQETGRRLQVVGASQHNFSRLPAGETYEFSATYQVVPPDPLIPAISLWFKVTLEADGRVTRLEVAHYNVIIPDTTKVADDATRAALTFFDLNSGVMRFSQDTPVLQNLRRNDVLVGEPSAAAPGGYLRKVTAIRRSGGEVVLQTTQANLTDAITQGSLDELGSFTADDLLGTEVFVQGVTAGAVSMAEGLETQAGVGDNYHFRIGFDEVALNLGEGDVSVQVKVKGDLYFNAGWGIHLGIKPCFDVPPVCVSHLEAKIGIEEWLKVELSGEARAKLTKEIRVARYYFKPLVFFIGPVPVVVTPTIEVYVGASGEVSLRFHYGVTQSASAVIGARWTKDGWRDISDFGRKLEGYDQFNFNATMNARAYTRALASLKFYDLAGPALGLVLGVELDSAIPRYPTWIARGFIEGNLAFVVGLPVVGTLRDYSTTLFRESIEFLAAPNQPPKFINVASGTIKVDVGRPVYIGPNRGFERGQFDIVEPEGDPISYSVMSSVDGAITIPGNYTFTTPGVRTLTVTARDNNGESTSITLRFEAVNVPPALYATVATSQVRQGVDYYISARAVAANGSDLDCDRMNWSVTPSGTVTLATTGSGCDVVVGFNQQGMHTVRVTATDSHGASTSRTFAVNVTSPPANPAPKITVFSIGAKPDKINLLCLIDLCEVPEHGRLFNQFTMIPESPYYVPPLFLFAQATDPDGDAVTLRWFCEGEEGQAAVTDLGNGSFRCDPTGLAPTSGGTVRVHLEASDGTTTVAWARSFEVGATNPR